VANGLTPKRKKFIEAYLKYWNGHKAAREANYAYPDRAAYELLRNPDIQAAIKERLQESAMEADEVLNRITQQARLNAAQFFNFEWKPIIDPASKQPVLDEDGNVFVERIISGVNWEEFERNGHLIKGLRYNRQGQPILEFYDVQNALLSMSKFLHIEDGSDNEKSDRTELSLPADCMAAPFLDAYRDIKAHNHTEYLFFGGRGSTKSSFISLVIIYLLVNNPEMHALATRQVANTLRDSVYSQLVWAINELGVSAHFKCTTSPLEITYIPTGQKIYFRGADNPEKIKSIKPSFGYIGLLWFEELDQFRGEEAIRKIEQSVIRGGDLAYIFKSFNPPKSQNNWANKYVKVPKTTRYQHSSNYLQVPSEWLGKPWLDEAEFLKSVNPAAYDHEYMGIANSAGGLIFENVTIRKITDEEIEQFDRILHGLDWGYYPDPAHYVKMHYDAARMTLYIFGEVRKWKAKNRVFYDALVEYGLTPEDLLICDSAEPKSIADFREYGASARGAEKGPESVKYSIKWLQSLVSIVIDPERCPFTKEEFLGYEHDMDKDGNFISSYPDRDNHAIDAVRYGTNFIWKRRGQ
jgi:PBSX family phage terminase large subunit